MTYFGPHRIAPLLVTLDDEECETSRRVGKKRNDESSGYDHVAGFEGDGEQIHIEGAAGECAFHKGMGLVWNQSSGTFKLPDARHNIQIRTATCKAYRPPDGFGTLIVRPRDDPRDLFALVVGHMPYFAIMGWIEGERARHKDYRRTEADRPSAWFVPNRFLHKNLDDLLR
jgi:hypothetical protein